MPNPHAMLVFSNPLAGQEDVYLEGYRRRHIAEVVAIEGVTAGRFYAVEADAAAELPERWGYVARYELIDPPGVVLDRIYAANASGELEVPKWIVNVGAWTYAADSDYDDWLGSYESSTLLLGGEPDVPNDALRSRTLTDAGHPFDPAYPSPWKTLTDVDGGSADGAVRLSPLAPPVRS